MKITAHALLSTLVGSTLAAYTVINFVSEGFAAPGAVLGLSFLAVYGLLEMALIEYVPLGSSRTPRPSAHITASKRTGAVVGFPAQAPVRRAA
jgi:hypothetical protein